MTAKLAMFKMTADNKNFWSLTFFVIYFTHLSMSVKVTDQDSAMTFLEQFGYKDVLKEGELRTDETIRQAFVLFQMFAGLNQTGELDGPTLDKMNGRRCGFPDLMGYRNVRRKRRYTANLALRWPKADLTYRIRKYETGGLLTQAQQRTILQRALKYWSDVSTLTFSEKFAEPADIVISFEPRSHGDENDFDGPNGVLAHAYVPETRLINTETILGDVHFDEEEVFLETTGQGVNLLQVATHEFGHSLGLGHSTVQGAVMAAFYSGYQPAFELHQDDIDGIQYVYGPTSGATDSPAVTVEPDDPLSCNGNFDAVMYAADGTVDIFYGFVGSMLYKTSSSYGSARVLETGYPKKISEELALFPEVCWEVDAVVNFSSSYFIFSGSSFCEFLWYEGRFDFIRSDFIQTRFPGLPNDIDASFVWSGNGLLYFTKGSVYYRWSADYQRVDLNYPRPLSNWKGLPARIDGSFKWRDHRTYFFSGDKHYKFNDRLFNVEFGYPRNNVQVWLGSCIPNMNQTTTMAVENVTFTDSLETTTYASATPPTTSGGRGLETWKYAIFIGLGLLTSFSASIVLLIIMCVVKNKRKINASRNSQKLEAIQPKPYPHPPKIQIQYSGEYNKLELRDYT